MLPTPVFWPTWAPRGPWYTSRDPTSATHCTRQLSLGEPRGKYDTSQWNVNTIPMGTPVYLFSFCAQEASFVPDTSSIPQQCVESRFPLQKEHDNPVLTCISIGYNPVFLQAAGLASQYHHRLINPCLSWMTKHKATFATGHVLF